MAEERFATLGRVEAVARLFENTGYKPFDSTWFETKGQAYATTKSRCFIEGTDFDLIYFPLKHLGYKCVTMVTGELYAEFSSPRTLSLVIGVPAKLDFSHIKELWGGVVSATKEHGYSKLALEVVPSMVGLSISVCAAGETSLLMGKRRPKAKSMDLICVSGSLGGAYLGLSVLEREKKKFDRTKDDHTQPQLDKYRDFVGEYLKPSVSPNILKLLEEAEIVPSYGYFITRGLADSVKCLVRDSGLGAKIYAEKVPFMGNSIDLSKELGVDPLAAALNGGDDCRLLFTIPIGSHEKFRHDFQTFDVIGHLAQPEVGAAIVTPDGVELPLHAQGWPKEEL